MGDNIITTDTSKEVEPNQSPILADLMDVTSELNGRRRELTNLTLWAELHISEGGVEDGDLQDCNDRINKSLDWLGINLIETLTAFDIIYYVPLAAVRSEEGLRMMRELKSTILEIRNLLDDLTRIQPSFEEEVGNILQYIFGGKIPSFVWGETWGELSTLQATGAQPGIFRTNGSTEISATLVPERGILRRIEAILLDRKNQVEEA